MTYMLDTNICIYAIKNKPERVLKQLYEHLEDGMCISSITLAELAHGVRKSLYPEKTKKHSCSSSLSLTFWILMIWRRWNMGRYARTCRGRGGQSVRLKC